MLGVSLFLRKIIARMAQPMAIRQFQDDEDDTRIEIKQLGKKNIPPVQFVLNGDMIQQDEGLIGVVDRKSNLQEPDELTLEIKSMGGDAAAEAFLAGSALSDGKAAGPAYTHGSILLSIAWCQKTGWKSEQTWGFEDIEGTKYLTRRMAVLRDGKQKLARWVYDFTA